MNVKETKKSIIQAGHRAVELNRIQEEEALLEGMVIEKEEKVFKGFAEGRSK